MYIDIYHFNINLLAHLNCTLQISAAVHQLKYIYMWGRGGGVPWVCVCVCVLHTL